MPSDAPRAAPDTSISPPESHPNLPRRGALALCFAAIVVCGVLGGGIGYGLVNTACPSGPTLAERLLEEVPGFHAHTPACGVKLFAGAVTGTVGTAIGAGVVAMLMLRAQSEWQSHPAGRALARSAPPGRGGSDRSPPPTAPFRPPPTGETPPHT